MKLSNCNFFSIFTKSSIDKVILLIANFLSFTGGVVLLIMVLINISSIFGRVVFGTPLVGDFELIEVGCAVSIFMFLPICKLKNGNIIVDTFTLKLSKKKLMLMDLIGDTIFGLIAIFFSYRMIYGLLDMIRYKEETMLLEIPMWIPFGPAIFSLFFLSVICFLSALHKFSILANVREY